MIVASEEACKEHDLAPLAKIVSYGVSGVEPSLMGIGPCPAIKEALTRAGKSLNDMAFIEVGTRFFRFQSKYHESSAVV